jgi:hypothetical protein
VRPREKVDFDFDALANPVVTFRLKKNAGDTQIPDLPCLPGVFADTTNPRRPLDVVPIGSPARTHIHPNS